MLQPPEMTISNTSIGNKCLLVEVRPKYKYEENQRTNTVIGYGYTVVLPDKRFERLTVKIDGKQQMETPDGYTEVYFDNLELYIYWSQGQYAVGARATGIHPVDHKT